MVPAEIVDQRRAPWPLLLEPLHFVGATVGIGVDPVRVLVEGRDVAGAGVREAPHRDAADAVGPLGVFVPPGDVVAGAGRQDVDLVLRDKPLGDQPAEVLGSSEHLRPVALDDEGESHEVRPSITPRSRTVRASPKSARRRRWPAITLALRSSSNASEASSSAAYSKSFGMNCTP